MSIMPVNMLTLLQLLKTKPNISNGCLSMARCDNRWNLIHSEDRIITQNLSCYLMLAGGSGTDYSWQKATRRHKLQCQHCLLNISQILVNGSGLNYMKSSFTSRCNVINLRWIYGAYWLVVVKKKHSSSEKIWKSIVAEMLLDVYLSKNW